MNELRETVVKVVFYTLFEDLEQVHYGLETHLQDACRNPSAFPVSQGLSKTFCWVWSEKVGHKLIYFPFYYLHSFHSLFKGADLIHEYLQK